MEAVNLTGRQCRLVNVKNLVSGPRELPAVTYFLTFHFKSPSQGSDVTHESIKEINFQPLTDFCAKCCYFKPVFLFLVLLQFRLNSRLKPNAATVRRVTEASDKWG